MRGRRVIVGLLWLLAGGNAQADAVPAALQGRWAIQAGQCAAADEGLTLTADGLTFVTSNPVSGVSTLLAVVDASEVGEFRARLTLVSVVQGGSAATGDSMPEQGDSLVLARMGDVLQALETMRGGVSRDVSGGDPLVRCP